MSPGHMAYLYLPLLIAGLAAHRVVAQSANGTVLNVPPDQYFDGDDGQWATFGVQVGTPSQNLRLLPGTGVSDVRVVVAEG
ncbi:hypothetical protein LTS18_010349, partial [Coniosporium uncinatum]